MADSDTLYHQIYQQGKLFGLDKKLAANPFRPKGKRPLSAAVSGGAFGDEGKGRITDELTSYFLKHHSQVIHYRDNGGANAGHSIQIGDTKLALHQIGSAILQPKATLISGKGMVLHPQDYVTELRTVKAVANGTIPARLIIDDMAALSLDTHRAFETALQDRAAGGRGSTGRGIAPAYADIIYRHPLRMRDLIARNWRDAFTHHYRLYRDLLKGLGYSLAATPVLRLHSQAQKVGSLITFLSRLEQARKILRPYTQSAYPLLREHWFGSTPFVFEKSQALGLDIRWGVYPDVTASDCAFTGIHASTEGLIAPEAIAAKVAVIKATYTSSVGSRRMPSAMKGKLADKIRADAHEYGTTTGRPRDIHHIDLPLLKFLRAAGGYTYLAPTHLDLAYSDSPIRVVVAYEKAGREIPYRPDQSYLLGVKPRFLELPSWNGQALQHAKKPSDLPPAALSYLAFLQQSLEVNLLLASTGPARHQTIRWF